MKIAIPETCGSIILTLHIMPSQFSQVSTSQIMKNLIPASSGIIYRNHLLNGDSRCAAHFADDILPEAKLEKYDHQQNGSRPCSIEFEFQCKQDRNEKLLVDYGFAAYDEDSVEDYFGASSDNFCIILNDLNIAAVPETNSAPFTDSTGGLNNVDYWDQHPFQDFKAYEFTKDMVAEGSIHPGWNTMKIGFNQSNMLVSDSFISLRKLSFNCLS